MNTYVYYNALPFGLIVDQSKQMTVCFPLAPEATGVSSKFTSRGQSPNYGDGPYFCSQAAGRPVGVYMSASPMTIDGIYCARTGPQTAIKKAGNQTTYYEWIVNKNSNGDYDVTEIQDSYWSGAGPYRWSQTYRNVISSGWAYVRVVGWEAGEFNFLQNEYEVFQAAATLEIYLAPYATLWSSAYVDAVDKIPHICFNAIEGVFDLIGFLRGLYTTLRNPIRALRELSYEVRDWGNDWLSYRYIYTTTKLDISEIKSGMRAISEINNLTKEEYSVTGRAKDGLISVGVTATFKMSSLIPSSYEELLRQYGLAPSAADLWDIIPFSFIVDWFAQLGDILENFGKFSNTLRYRPTQIWFTAVTEYQGQKTFFRVPGTRLSIPPKYEFRETSDKTLAMRITDFIAIFKPKEV